MWAGRLFSDTEGLNSTWSSAYLPNWSTGLCCLSVAAGDLEDSPKAVRGIYFRSALRSLPPGFRCGWDRLRFGM